MSRSTRRRTTTTRKLRLTALEERLTPAIQWSGGGLNDLWSNDANWNAHVTGDGSEALDFPAGVTHKANFNDLAGKFNSIQIDDSGYVLKGNSIGTASAVLPLPITGTGSIDSTIELNLDCPTRFDLTGSATVLHMKGQLTGTLTKDGPGTLELIGSNTTSTTTVNDGTLELNAGTNISVPGSLIIGDGSGAANSAVVQLAHNDQIGDLSAVTINADGKFDMNGFVDTISPLTVNSGTVSTALSSLTVTALTMTAGLIDASSGSFHLAGDVTVNASSVAATIKGNLNLDGGTRTFTVANGSATNDLAIDGVISNGGSNGGLTKAGGGDLRFLGSSANTYTGTTTVAAGALILNKSAGVTSVAGPLVVSANLYDDSADQIADTVPVTINGGLMGLAGNETIGPLVMTGGTINTNAKILTLASDVTVNASANASTITGNLNLGGPTRTFTVENGSAANDLAINGVISNGGLTKAGAGDLRMLGGSANMYTDTTTVADGALILNKSAGVTSIAGQLVVGANLYEDSDNQIDDTTHVFISGGLMGVGGLETIGPLTMTGGRLAISSGKILTLAGDVFVNQSSNTALIDGAGQLSLGSASREFYVVDGSAPVDLDILASIAGTGTILKDGDSAGTMSIDAGTNPFSGGTFVYSGTLLVDGSMANSSVSVNGTLTQGTLGGMGTTGPANIGGVLNPGDGNTVGTLHTGNLLLKDSAVFRPDINGPAASNYDQVAVTGTVTLGDRQLDTQFGFTPNVGDSFRLIDNDGSDAIVGTFANLPEGAMFSSGGKGYQITYTGGDGNDVVITRVPAAVIVKVPAPLFTTEGGRSDYFWISLASIPSGDVTINLSSSNPAEGTIDKASLTFTPSNALTPQRVNVTGVADTVADGNVKYSIVIAPAISSDPDYSGIRPQQDAQAVNLELLPKGTRTFTDSDDDTYTVKLTGPGTVAALLNDATGNGGAISEIFVDGTDPAKSSLSISVKKALAGDGHVAVNWIEGTGLKSVSMKAVDMVQGGLGLTGPLGSLTVHDLLSSGVSDQGTPDHKTRIRAHRIEGSQIHTGSAIGRLSAANIMQTDVEAPSLGSLVVTGDKANAIRGDFFYSGVTLSGTGVLPGKPTLGSVRIAGRVLWSTFTVDSGNVGAFRAGAFEASDLFVGFKPKDLKDPMAGGTFTPGSTIGSFRTTGYNGLTTPAFTGSTIAADIIGTVSLISVEVVNAGKKFGVAGHTQIGSVSVANPAFHYTKDQANTGMTDFEVELV